MKFKLSPISLFVSLVTVSTLFPLSANALSVPDEFASLFNYESKKIDFEDVNGRFHSVDMKVNYNSVKIESDSAAQTIRDILEIEDLDPGLINTIIKDLKVGITNTDECTASIEACVLTPETYAIAFDYYTDKVYFWVNPVYLDVNYKEGETVYASARNENAATINRINLYGNTNDYNDSFSAYDDITIGLPFGNISSEFSYESESEDEFEIDELLYDFEFDQYRIQMGYTRNRSSFNATDFMINDVNNGEWALDFGTSSNLILNGQAIAQKIFFFAPQNGVLSVMRDGKILFQKNVSQGQGFITNDDLPRGRYDVQLVIKSGDSVVRETTQSIFNTADDSLVIGDTDFRITTGAYGRSNSDLLVSLDGLDSDPTITEEMEDELVGDSFVRGVAAYRLTDRVILGYGGSTSSSGSYVNLGTTVYLPYDARFSLSAYGFDDNSTQYEAEISRNGWSASVEQFDADDDREFESTLSKYMFDDTDYERYSLSANMVLSNSLYGYLTYNYLKKHDSDSITGYTSNYISGGFSFDFIANSTIDFNASYDLEDESDRDKLRATVVWTVPLSDFITARASITSTESDINYFSGSLETEDIFDSKDVYMTAQVSQSWSDTEPENVSTISTSGQINKDEYVASLYTYADSDGGYTLNGNIGSTQVFTGKNVYFTGIDSDAYLAVNTESKIRFDEDSASRGLLVTNIDGEQTLKSTLYKDKVIVPLNDYGNYDAYLDTESVDLFNVGDDAAGAFSLPGTVIELEPEVSRVISFVSGFKDIFDQSVDNVTCQGDGCVSISEIMDGVYKISVKEGEHFTLNQAPSVCLIPPLDDAMLFNFGQNYCLPDVDLLAGAPIEIDGEDKQIYFLGAFSKNISDKVLNDYSADIGSDIEIIQKEIGSNNYLYAVSDAQYTLTAQVKSVFSKMNKFAVIRTIDDTEYALQR